MVDGSCTNINTTLILKIIYVSCMENHEIFSVNFAETAVGCKAPSRPTEYHPTSTALYRCGNGLKISKNCFFLNRC